MSALIRGAIGGVLLMAASQFAVALSAAAQDSSPDSRMAKSLPRAANPQGMGSSWAAVPIGQSGPADNQWRSVWHEGRWWYWLPSSRWLVWDGRQWVNYRPGTKEQFPVTARPNSHPQQSYYRGPIYGAPAYQRSQNGRPAIPPSFGNFGAGHGWFWY